MRVIVIVRKTLRASLFYIRATIDNFLFPLGNVYIHMHIYV